MGSALQSICENITNYHPNNVNVIPLHDRDLIRSEGSSQASLSADSSSDEGRMAEQGKNRTANRPSKASGLIFLVVALSLGYTGYVYYNQNFKSLPVSTVNSADQQSVLAEPNPVKEGHRGQTITRDAQSGLAVSEAAKPDNSIVIEFSDINNLSVQTPKTDSPIGANVEASILKLEDSALTVRDDVNSLRDVVSGQSSTIAANDAAIKSFERTILSLSNGISEMKTSLNAVNEKIAAQNRLIETNRAQIESLNKRFSEFQLSDAKPTPRQASSAPASTASPAPAKAPAPATGTSNVSAAPAAAAKPPVNVTAPDEELYVIEGFYLSAKTAEAAVISEIGSDANYRLVWGQKAGALGQVEPFNPATTGVRGTFPNGVRWIIK